MTSPKTIRHFVAMMTALAGLLAGVGAGSANPLAKDLFGARKLPAATAAQSFGFYSKGCFSGGVAIPVDGPHWQVMRVSRNRRWGHPALISLLERFSDDAAADGWPGLLVGDISQPRGGPMTSGHASHQIGLDADIWFTPMPDNRLSIAERERKGAISLIRKGTLTVDEGRWSPVYERLLKRVASYPDIERVLVHPGIKKKLCDTVTGDRSWLSKIRPFWGHDEHFHIRIGCQPGSPGCKPQSPPPRNDGCDKSLAWWFTEEPWRPAKNPDAPKARDVMTMNALPRECRAVLDAPNPPSVEAVTLRLGGDAPVTAPSMSPPISASAFADTPASAIPTPFPRPAN